MSLFDKLYNNKNFTISKLKLSSEAAEDEDDFSFKGPDSFEFDDPDDEETQDSENQDQNDNQENDESDDFSFSFDDEDENDEGNAFTDGESSDEKKEPKEDPNKVSLDISLNTVLRENLPEALREFRTISSTNVDRMKASPYTNDEIQKLVHLYRNIVDDYNKFYLYNLDKIDDSERLKIFLGYKFLLSKIEKAWSKLVLQEKTER